MPSNKGLILVITAPSGAGKGTIIRRYLRNHSDTKLSVSCTTREMRPDDVEGETYFFISKSKFEQMIENDEFLEYDNHFLNYYGTPKKYVLDNINDNNNMIIEVDYKGAFIIKEKIKEAVLVFLLPPNALELKNRLQDRPGDSEKQKYIRFKRALEEVEQANQFDYILINDKIKETEDKLENIIRVEKNPKECIKEEIELVQSYKMELQENQNFISNFIEQLKNLNN